MKPTTVWLGAMTSALVGGLVVAGIIVMLRGTSEPEPPAPPPPAAEETSAEAHHEVPPDLVPVFTVTEPEVEEKDETDDAAVERKTKRRKRGKRKGKAAAASGDAAPASTVKLTTAQISAGIKSSLSSLGPCFKAARKRKEMNPGKHALVIDFRIQPDGSVRDAALTGPAYLTNKRVAKCVANKIRAWRFPPSAQGSPVRNLQLPIAVK